MNRFFERNEAIERRVGWRDARIEIDRLEMMLSAADSATAAALDRDQWPAR